MNLGSMVSSSVTSLRLLSLHLRGALAILSAADRLYIWSAKLLESYGFVGIFAVIDIAFPFLVLFPAYLLRPRPKRSPKGKYATYECGLDTIGPTWVQFNVRFYLYALVFVIFDVETVFLYPWAVAFKQLGFFAFAEMVIFILILLVGYFYAWRKKALEWT